MHLDDLVGCCGDEDLKFTGFVERTVEESEQTLVGNVWPVVCRVSFEFVSDVIGVVLTIEENSLFFDIGDLKSGFFKNNDNFSFINFVFFSEMDDFGGS